ncbi:(Fe-S)-binding protein [Thermodesulfatator autotrophicus]|uniref:4Fe-4S ferredoxin-type domain-containing protein n=1 Tax=Thermodesulfatator autotrophicus TaxID=1795632 RepID=A0A177E419_9BACT|nr:(Fe-S)-binding protein [Thermodesulfatator autotrophicus]OAG26723.1 hypothetical protein TH606_10805 [Thermodesulfatator autotrophicus]
MKPTDLCARCGKCLVACPVFRATRRETFSPRGRLLALEEGRASFRFFASCLLCGACERACPNNVPLLETLVQAKLSHPIPTKYLLALADKLRPLASESFSLKKELAFLNGKKVAIFLGCGGEFFYPQAIKKLVSLSPAPTDLFVPQEQTCCGLPFIAAGDEKTFKKQVERNLKAFEKVDIIITLCASCLFTLKKIYPLMGAYEIAEKAFDAMAYLALNRGFNFNVPKEEIFFQVPCHLKHLETYPWWRELGITYYEGCCGQAGAFGYLFPQEAEQIRRSLFKEMEKNKPYYLATACTSCLLALKKAYPNFPVKMLVEYLKEK